jgi:hypothetical protein
VSTDAQQKEGTIESQVLELKRQVAAAGDVLVKEYVDNGYSGTLLHRAQPGSSFGSRARLAKRRYAHGRERYVREGATPMETRWNWSTMAIE